MIHVLLTVIKFVLLLHLQIIEIELANYCSERVNLLVYIIMIEKFVKTSSSKKPKVIMIDGD